MIQSPFIEQINYCRGSMKKLRKKIYKYNINRPSKAQKSESTIKNVLDVLQTRNIPQFLKSELKKYSDLSFSALSGFSLPQIKPLSEISKLTSHQEKQIQDIYHINKRTIKKRRSVYPVLKLDKRPTNSHDIDGSPYSSTSLEGVFDNEISDLENESNSQESQVFEPIGQSNTFDHEFNHSDAMFQSTMLDFGNEIEMDSEQFLFKC